nr:ATP-binding protein [Tessaracoccus coleopterorum]
MSVSPSPTISRETPESLPDLAPAVEVAAYRVTSEAVTNAVRHADAARILVTLATTAEGISVSVTDDGSGWDASPDVTHAGLSTMRERTEEIGGRLSIQSGRAGTSVHA